MASIDKWTKKKAAASNGGAGMCKYIDYEEKKRLSRLANVRGSVNQAMKHNSWQASLLEKRRKEQIKQRKIDNAKKKNGKKKGFEVDTSASSSGTEFTKCGLKLKLSSQPSTSATTASKKSREVLAAAAKRENDILANKPLVSQFARDSIELNRRKNATNRKKPSSLPTNKPSNGIINMKKANTTKNKVGEKKATVPPNKKDSDEAAATVRAKAGSKGKENGDSNNADTKQILAEGKILLRRKSTTKKKTSDSYYMDFESLKREHADAISMLKQLDEENKRLFVKKDEAVDDSNAYAATFGWAGGEDSSEELEHEHVDESIVPVSVPEGLLNATHLSIDIDNNNEEYDVEVKDEAQVGGDNDAIDTDDDDDDDSERTSSYYNDDSVLSLDTHEEADRES